MTGVWTPGWIWFTNPEKGPPGIWRVRVDEPTGKPLGAPEPVLRSTAEIGGGVSATPSASRLVFSAISREINLLRWDVDPATGGVAPQPRTILGGGRPVYVPRPSPGGRWVAAHLLDQSNEFREDLLLVDETTGEVRRLTDDALREADFDWAPDGSWLYFCVALEGGSELWKIRLDGSGRQRVLGTNSPGEVLMVLASPDGRSLYVEAGKSHLPYLVELGAAGVQGPPKALPSMPDGRVFVARDWSADGRRIAGISRKPDGSFDDALVLLDVEAKAYRTFAVAKVGDFEYCFWLPDSRRLLLHAGSGEVRVFDPETGSATPAGSIGHGAYNVSYSRDGRGLYANKSGRSMFDVWMLDYDVTP